MRDRFDPGTFFAGLVFLAVGVAFVMEALEYWAFGFRQLRWVGPAVLVVVGIGVLIGSWSRGASRPGAGLHQP